LAERIGIDETAIIEKVRQALERKTALAARASGRPGPPKAKKAGGGDLPRGTPAGGVDGDASRLESKIVAMILQYPDIIGKITEKKVLSYFVDDCLKAIGEAVVSFDNYTTAHIPEIINKLADPGYKETVAALSIQDDSWDDQGCRRLITQFLTSRVRRQNNLLQKIRAAEESNNLELLLELLKQKQNQARDRQGNNLTSTGG